MVANKKTPAKPVGKPAIGRAALVESPFSRRKNWTNGLRLTRPGAMTIG